MPRIPIIPPPEDGAGGAATVGGYEGLAPEDADALRALEARTARIDRELAVSQSWGAAAERLAQAADDPEGSPSGFTRSFLEETDRERGAVLKSVPVARRATLDQDLLGLREEFADRAADVEADGLALRRRLGLQQTLERYRTGVAHDPGLYDRAAGRMVALVADLGLPDDRREPMRLHVKDALGNAALDGLMGEPERAARVLSQGLYDDALTEASKAARLKEAEGLAARNRLLARERALAELTARAEEGAAPDDAIAAAESDGRLTAAEAAHLRQRNAAAAQAAALREGRIQRVASAAGSFDPLDPEDKAAVSDYWDRVSEAYASDDAASQQRAELAFVERLGVLPAALGRKYQGALLSDDPAFVVLGAEAIDALAKLDPALLDGMSEDRVRRAQIVARYAELGLPPERSIALAEKDIEKGGSSPATKSVGIQVAAAEPPVMSDAVVSGAPDEAPDGSGHQPDGSVIVTDPETGERRTIAPEDAARLDAFAREHGTALDLHAAFLDAYDKIASGAMTREEATRALLDAIDKALPAMNEAGGVLAADLPLRQTLQRLATDIFDERDRAAADAVISDALIPSGRAREIGELILSLLPVTGEVLSAAEAYEGFSAALDAMRRGDMDAALDQAGEAALSTAGAIPLAGRVVRLGRGAVRVFRMLRDYLRRKEAEREQGGVPEPTPGPGPGDLLPRPREPSDDPGKPETPRPELPEWLPPDPERWKVDVQREKERMAPTAVERRPVDFNNQFVEDYRERNKDNPNASEPHRPYEERAPGYEGPVASGGRTFIRVVPSGASGPGRWLMSVERFEEIRARPDATQVLKDELALPEEPKSYSVVTIPETTEVRIGIVSRHPVWGTGGGVQIEIRQKWDEEWFSKVQGIKP